MRVTQRCCLAGVIAISGAACATTAARHNSVEEADADLSGEHGHVPMAMPPETAAVRDNKSSPILQVATVGKVVYPVVYGYPLYPEGEAAHGITALRGQNGVGSKQVDREDDEGVVHATEDFPQLGCHFEGIRENLNKFVPLSLTCELPAPKPLGGSKRPVLGSTMAGAKAEQVLQEPSVKEAFLGAFHLTSDDFATGSGTGYFNTTHGQLALVFSRKKLSRLVYYFDPGVKSWQNPALWVKP
jgi:hypothetical protein